MTRRMGRRTDWSRATDRMPASFVDSPLQGRRTEDGLDLVEAVTAGAALAAVAQVALGDPDAPVREEAVGVSEDEVLAAETENPGPAEPDADGDDED